MKVWGKKSRNSVLEALKVLEGLELTWEEVSLPHSKYALATYYLLSSSEASANLARFDGVRFGLPYRMQKHLIEMYKKTRSEGFGDEVKRRIMLGTFALSSGYYDAYYKKAQKVRTLIKKDFEDVFEKYDVIVGPTTPTPAFKIGEKIADPLTMYANDILTIPVNLAGVPGISVPCGLLLMVCRLVCKSSGSILMKARFTALPTHLSKQQIFINNILSCKG